MQPPPPPRRLLPLLLLLMCCRRVLKWDRHYNPHMDRVHSFVQTRHSASWRTRHSLELVEQEGSHPLLLRQDVGVGVGDQAVTPAEAQLAAAKGVADT